MMCNECMSTTGMVEPTGCWRVSALAMMMLDRSNHDWAESNCHWWGWEAAQRA